MIIRKIARIIAGAVAFIMIAVVIYLFSAFILSAIKVKGEPASGETISIYLISNGVHSDLALPVKNNIKDWSGEIKYNHTKNKDTIYRYLAFGWGDKAFYLETPTWADLKFKTAFNAIFGLGPSAVHATFYKNLEEDDDCINLNLSNEQYQQLVEYIENSFELDKEGNIQLIQTNANYGTDDAFYEARGRYNLFKTCNTWTNNGLKVSGQKACLWTPFDKGIFWHYRGSKEEVRSKE